MSSNVTRRLLEAFSDPGGRQQALSLLSSVPVKSIIKDIRDTGYGNSSLLHHAARWGWTDIIELLVYQYDCDPDYTDRTGWTMLHLACMYDRTATVQYLTTTLCMDPLQKNRLGYTPLYYSNGETRQYLLGIIENSDGGIPLDYSGTRLYLQRIIDDAKKQGFGTDVVKYLKHLKRLKYAEAALEEAMKEGGGELFLSNIVLHGPPGAGKSSLKGIILGQPPLPKHKQNATDILEKSVRAVCTNRVTTSTTRRLFEVVDNDQIIERLAGEVETHRKKKVDKVFSSSPTQIDSSDSSIPKAGSSASTSVSSVPDAAKIDFPSKNISSSTKAEESIKKKLMGTKASSKMFDSRWHHYVDSGGQPQFLDVLPLLYRSPSHFIVVMRLTEGLDDKPKVRFYNQGNDVYELPDHLVLTNREMIVRTCQMAQSIAQATSGKFVPRVFVMGTHIDQLWFFSRSKHLRKLNEELAPIYKIYSDVMICKSPEEFIFPLNAMSKGKERRQYTKEIQQHIQSATEECCNPVTAPLKWLIFHLEIDKGEGVVRMSECYKVGEKLGMQKDRVHLALEFLNQAALILYYPADVPDLVLTKTDPFTNRLSRLIKASFIPPDNGPAKESIQLREKGVFKKLFLKRVFEGVEDSLISDNEFLKLLESLKVAVHIGGEEYFIPSALSLEPPFKGSTFECELIPLALLWQDFILPHGFFLTVAVELLEKPRSEDSYAFELRTDIPQWRGEVQVGEVKQKIPGIVKLTDRKRWIQVSYLGDTTYCPLIHQLVDRATLLAVKRFKHTGIEPPTIGYACPLCEKKDHYCYLSSNKCFITCSVTRSKTGPVTPNMSCWTRDARKFGLQSSHDISDKPTPTRPEETERVTLPQGHKGRDEPIPTRLCQPQLDQVPSLIVSPVDDSILSASDDNLLAVLRSTIEVTDWFTLGMTLGLPQHKLERIEVDGSTEMKHQRKMVSLWLNTGGASWKELVQALIDPLVDKEEIAKRIAEQHPLKH